MNNNKNINSKKYSKQALIGQKGVNLIEQIVLEMGYVWNPTNLDAGIDGIIEIKDTETDEATNLIIQVQSKASENGFKNETENAFDFYCKDRDLHYWLKGNCPVLLVCCDVSKRKAYWKSIKNYFTDQELSTKITFDKKTDEFAAHSKHQIAELAQPKESGIYFTPPPIEETVYSNILPLTNFPKVIFQAKTKYRNFKNLWGSLNELENKQGINKSFILKEGKIFFV